MSPSGGGRWTFPSGCRDDLCRLLEWEPLVRQEEDSVKITISGTGRDYIGFLITTDLAAVIIYTLKFVPFIQVIVLICILSKIRFYHKDNVLSQR